MYNIKRILIGLDLSPLDPVLIKYTSYIASILKSTDIYFFHIAASLEVPEEIKEEFPGVATPVDENIKSVIRKNLDENYSRNDNCKLHIEVREGNAAEKILHWSEIKKVDLIIMGRKRELKGSGSLPGKMVKLSHCSVLMVPEDASLEISKILVPIDFSKSSKLAVEEAVILTKLTNSELIFHHAYHVPTGYHTSGKSYEEFAEIMLNQVVKEFNRYIKEIDLPYDEVRCEYTLDKHQDPAEQASEIANKINVDIIIIGSRGRQLIASIILGSVAEKMTKYDDHIPLLVVKDKKQNLNFFEALMKL